MLVEVPQLFAMIRRGIFEAQSRRSPPVRLAGPLLLRLSGIVRCRIGVNLGWLLFSTIHREFGPSARLLVIGGVCRTV